MHFIDCVIVLKLASNIELLKTFQVQMPYVINYCMSCVTVLLGVHELGAIEQCTVLERLDLSRNCIQSISGLANLINLTYLNLSSNQLTSLGTGSVFAA